MRKILIVAGALLGITLVLKASAQQPGGFWTGTDPRKIEFKTIDTSRALRPSATSRAFHAPSNPTPTGIGRFFPKLSLGSWPPNRANVSVLDQKKNPFQPNPKGFNPFDNANKGKK